jgi:hypothetical protein
MKNLVHENQKCVETVKNGVVVDVQHDRARCVLVRHLHTTPML